MSIRGACTLLVFAVTGAHVSRAQETGFSVGQLNAGAVVGFGEIRGAALSFGVRIEKGVASLEDLGDGMLGIQLLVDRYSYTGTSGGYHYAFTHTLFSAIANYHLGVEDKRWDPFVGLGLGHEQLSASARDFGPPYAASASAGLFFVIHAGFRYYVTPKLAAYVDVGTGGASLNAGATYTLK